MSLLSDDDPKALAGARQRDAAHPETNAWVSASAGSGKTKVLTDRVLGLLLTGCRPERLLCLTFTKAAAAEMSNRLAGLLAKWAVMAPEKLEVSLGELTGTAPTREVMKRARRLFAEVLDTPGGMKVQTIHAFCQALLSRFPLEAGVAPQAKIMDDREAGEILTGARHRVLSEAGTTGPLAEAMAELAVEAHELSFDGLMQELVRERSRLTRALRRPGGREAAIAALYHLLDVREGDTPEILLEEVWRMGAADEAGLRDVARAFEAGSKTEGPKAKVLWDWLAGNDAKRAVLFDEYRGLFLTEKAERRSRLLTKDALAAFPTAHDVMVDEAERLQVILERVNAARIARANAALITVGGAILEAYEAAKRSRALLDYDDLILIARDLLSGPGAAAWVLYKLDGGIDHVLIDEAQDTNPDQWEVVRALTEEFFAGAGAREVERTLFVVGDAKQSIYSFQRADPAVFEAMRNYFQAKVTSAGRSWALVPMEVSFRSTAVVLAAVDATFAEAEARKGVGFAEEEITHRPARVGEPGRVELWPPIDPPEREADEWALPFERRQTLPAMRRLARKIARLIHYWTIDPKGEEDRECLLASKGRRLRPDDVLILVRRRNTFVEELVRELKALDVPVAGIDRMVLTEQLAVQDLIALGRVMLQPEDNLTLASLLKSPLVGLSEDQLFQLAHHRREKQSLWSSLEEAAKAEGERTSSKDAPSIRAAWEDLSDLLAQADFRPPYEFYADLLGTRGGRKKLLARLGGEAADPIEEFLSLLLFYERDYTPSLEGFLHWLERGEQEIKRDMEHGLAAVRIMTVHGAKGLQAPVVFLPDTLQKPRPSQGLLWPKAGDGLPLWPVRKSYSVRLTAALGAEARALQEEEYRRLLYVAMTRAEDRLYLCGWNTRRESGGGTWYHLARLGLEALAADAPDSMEILTLPGEDGEVLRLEGRGEVGSKEEAKGSQPEFEKAVTPSWVERNAPAEPWPPAPLRPSRPALLEPALLSPLDRSGERRFQRGRLIHRLLQSLPEIGPERRRGVARRFLTPLMTDVGEGELDAMIAETLAVLDAPDLAALFGPGSQAEVPITGLIESEGEARVVSGQVDRLVQVGDTLMIIDYKTNRPPPETAADVPLIYLSQMAAYRAVLGKVYPGKIIECYLLWTDDLHFMQLDDPALDEVLF